MKSYSLSELPQVAREILKAADSKILLFYGEMGAGKTTLIKEIAKQLGVIEIVSSPTFSLVNEYETETGEHIYHFDFYRIENEEEAMNIGTEEYFYSGEWNLVEWPEKIPALIPPVATCITLHKSGHEQRIYTLENV